MKKSTGSTGSKGTGDDAATGFQVKPKEFACLDVTFKNNDRSKAAHGCLTAEEKDDYELRRRQPSQSRAGIKHANYGFNRFSRIFGGKRVQEYKSKIKE
jgi:hypothetical protein